MTKEIVFLLMGFLLTVIFLFGFCFFWVLLLASNLKKHQVISEDIELQELSAPLSTPELLVEQTHEIEMPSSSISPNEILKKKSFWSTKKSLFSFTASKNRGNTFDGPNGPADILPSPTPELLVDQSQELEVPSNLTQLSPLESLLTPTGPTDLSYETGPFNPLFSLTETLSDPPVQNEPPTLETPTGPNTCKLLSSETGPSNPLLSLTKTLSDPPVQNEPLTVETPTQFLPPTDKIIFPGEECFEQPPVDENFIWSWITYFFSWLVPNNI